MCLTQQSGTFARPTSNYRAFTHLFPLTFSPQLCHEAPQSLHPTADCVFLDPFYLSAVYMKNQPTFYLRSLHGTNIAQLEEGANPDQSNDYEMAGQNDELVLVIDDEDDVRTVTVEVLQEAQLKTLQAANGPAGIALFRQHAPQVKLVILDFFMPGMNGEQVLHKLRSIDPRIPVIFFSGFSEYEVMGRIPLRNGITFLQKPYTINALWEIVQQYL